jgi:DNA-binding transcriptional LysR family regulator
VQALEEQLGFPLLIRHASKGVTLTRKGEELVALMERIMPQIREFATDLDATTNKPKPRKIRVTATHAQVAHGLGTLFFDIIQEYPDITFELIADDHMTDIVLKDADIGIQPLDPTRNDRKVRGVQYEYLFSLEKRLYASPRYIDTYGEPKSIEELRNHRILAFPQPEASINNRIINWILTLGMPEGELHNPVYTSNSIENLIQLAEKGIGIIGSYAEYEIIRNSCLKNILPNVKDKPLKEYFIYHDHLKKDPVIMNIKNYLIKSLRKE